MQKIPFHIILVLLCIQTAFSQSTTEELYNNFSSHNFLKHDRFFLNPTFSVVRENSTALSFLSRNKFSEFDNSPQLYVGSYSGRVHEKVGLGFGVFQQNFGVFKNFGVVVNYAYQVPLSEKNSLAFGFNFLYAKSGLDRTRIVTTTNDPFLNSFQDRSIINFQPAVNFSLGNFDVGIFLENLVDYDLKSNEFITSFQDKTISGHLMYTKPFKSKSGFLSEGKIQLLSMIRKPGQKDITLSGNILLDLPKFGWVQATYDDFYGTAIGFGVNLSKKLAIGFVHEKGKNNLGATNEVGMTYFFGKKEYSKKEENKKQLLEEEKKDSIILKGNQVEKILDTYKKQQDSIRIAQKREADKKHLLLLRMMKNNQNNNPPEIVSNRKISNSIPKQLEAVVTNKYYLIANYFSIHKNATAFVKTLQEKGLKAQYFQHPKNKYYYVYLDTFNTLTEAREARKSKLNNTYKDAMSILKIKEKGIIKKPKQSKKEVKPIQTNTNSILKKKKIKINKLKAGKGIEPGYYIIVNVFSKKHYADSFVDKLKNKQLNPLFFVYPKNKYRYVYLAKNKSKEEIIKLYQSHLNGEYDKEKWIMHIE